MAEVLILKYEQIAPIWKMFLICNILSRVVAYWDVGTSTLPAKQEDIVRVSRFLWMKSESQNLKLFYPEWDWYELAFRRRLYTIAGISHDFINLGTAVLLNRRTLLTSANYLDPYMDKQTELRIWALGRTGSHDTPWRYRVWRVTRLFPKSLNPEHCHGPFCYHSPRHDLAIIHSYDQMFLYTSLYNKEAFAYRGFLPNKDDYFDSNDIWYTGSGFQNLRDIYENYRILYAVSKRDYVVDCSKYIPKWWGKFICIVNSYNFPGVQNGGALFRTHVVYGIGCFEIRYNEDRIFAFTDIRYYLNYIYLYAHIYPGEYYEYAYPEWGQDTAYLGLYTYSMIPAWQVQYDIYPMGKK